MRNIYFITNSRGNKRYFSTIRDISDLKPCDVAREVGVSGTGLWIERVSGIVALDDSDVVVSERKQALIDTYVALRAEIRLNDAESCTSYEEEFASVFRLGAPIPLEMSDEELEAAIDAARESLAVD